MFIVSLIRAWLIGRAILRDYVGMNDKIMHKLWGCRMAAEGIPAKDIHRIAVLRERFGRTGYSQADINATMAGVSYHQSNLECDFRGLING